MGGQGLSLRVGPLVLGRLANALLSMSKGQVPGQILECSTIKTPAMGLSVERGQR